MKSPRKFPVLGKESVFVVIAAFNEESRVGSVVQNLRHAGYSNVVVVDDGSTDNTAHTTEAAGAITLSHVINRGQGAALQTGISYALENGADYLVTFDADGQHRIEDLSAMLGPVQSGEVEVTLGSRFLENRTKMPFMRKFLLKGSVIVQWLFYRVKTTDAHSGFRVFSRHAAERIKITCDRMAHASEIIEEIHKGGLTFKEVPISVLYTKEVLQKGNGSFYEAFRVLYSMVMKRFLR